MPRDRFPFGAGKEIHAMAIDLEEGQAWDDVVSLTLTREQSMIALTACSIMLGNVMEGLEEAAQSANRGDITAILVGPHLAQSARDLQGTMRSMAETLLPALISEVDANDAASKAEAEAKA